MEPCNICSRTHSYRRGLRWSTPQEEQTRTHKDHVFHLARYHFSMSDSATELPPVRIFLSYVRNDDASFTIVEPLKLRLQQLITALSGRPSQIFVDRNDIPLGENWREKIEAAVRHAYFFVPIYTGSYTQSQMCRDEFFLFQDAASQRDVNGLIIPIIWFGLETLRPEGEDEISDYVRAHQAAMFDQAWIEGPDSPPYRKNVTEIAKRILSVAPSVDKSLAEAEEREAGILIDSEGLPAGPAPSVPSLDHVSEEVEIDEEDGILELGADFENELLVLTESAESLGAAISDLGDLPDPPTGAQATNSSASKYMIQVASKMKGPALVIEDKGQEMFQATKRSDSLLRRIVQLAQHSDSPELIGKLHASLAEGVESLTETKAVAAQLDQLLSSMKTPEALSASIRRSVKPARRGIVAVQDSIQIIGEWAPVVESLVKPQDNM